MVTKNKLKNFFRILQGKKPVYRVKCWTGLKLRPGGVNYISNERIQWIITNKEFS